MTSAVALRIFQLPPVPFSPGERASLWQGTGAHEPPHAPSGGNVGRTSRQEIHKSGHPSPPPFTVSTHRRHTAVTSREDARCRSVYRPVGRFGRLAGDGLALTARPRKQA